MYTCIMIEQKRERETMFILSVTRAGEQERRVREGQIVPVISERFQTPMCISGKISRSINSAQQISLVILKGIRYQSSPLYASCITVCLIQSA